MIHDGKTDNIECREKRERGGTKIRHSKNHKRKTSRGMSVPGAVSQIFISSPCPSVIVSFSHFSPLVQGHIATDRDTMEPRVCEKKTTELTDSSVVFYRGVYHWLWIRITKRCEAS